MIIVYIIKEFNFLFFRIDKVIKDSFQVDIIVYYYIESLFYFIINRESLRFIVIYIVSSNSFLVSRIS